MLDGYRVARGGAAALLGREGGLRWSRCRQTWHDAACWAVSNSAVGSYAGPLGGRDASNAVQQADGWAGNVSGRISYTPAVPS